MLQRHALPALVLSLTASTLPAQETPPFITPDTSPDYDVLEWPQGPEWQNTGSFGRWVAGVLTSSFGGSAIGLRGGSLYLMEGFQFFETLVPFDTLTTMDMSGVVHDVAVLEGAGTGGRDAVITRDSINGLVAHVFVPPTTVPSVPGSFTSTVINAGPAWRNSGSLLVHGELVFGSRLKKVRSYSYDRGSDTYTAAATVLFGSNIVEFVAGDFDGNGSVDLAASTVAPDVEIRPADLGTILPPLGLEADAMTSVPDPRGGELLVIAYSVGDQQWLQTRAASSVVQDFRLQVAPWEDGIAVDLDVYALVRGDFVEGHEGLIVAHQSFAQSIVLLRDSDSMLYSVDLEENFQRVAFEAVPGSVPVPENVGIPTFWSDALYARNVIVYPADSLDGVARTTSPAPVYYAAEVGDGTDVMRKGTYYHANGNSQLKIHFKVPELLPSTFNYFDVVVFRQSTEGLSVEAPAERFWFPLSFIPQDRRMNVTLNLGGPDSPFVVPSIWTDPAGPVFWTGVRFLEGDWNGGDPIEGPAVSTAIFGWRRNHEPDDASSGYESYLVGLPWFLETLELVDGDPVPDPGGGYTFGMLGMSTRMPAFQSQPQVPLPILGDEAASN